MAKRKTKRRYPLWVVCGYVIFMMIFGIFYLPYRIIKELRKSSAGYKVKGATGYDYEKFIASYLKQKGFSRIKVTKKAGDYGVDVTAYKGRSKYAVQCKYYSDTVGVDSVQQVVGGMVHYGCSRAMVVTNSSFSEPAKCLARENNVILWDRIPIGKRVIPWRKIALWFSIVTMCVSIIAMLASDTTDGNMAAYIYTALISATLMLSFLIPELIEEIKIRRAERKIDQSMPEKQSNPTAADSWERLWKARHGLDKEPPEEVSDTWQNPINSKADTTELEFTTK